MRKLESPECVCMGLNRVTLQVLVRERSMRLPNFKTIDLVPVCHQPPVCTCLKHQKKAQAAKFQCYLQSV